MLNQYIYGSNQAKWEQKLLYIFMYHIPVASKYVACPVINDKYILLRKCSFIQFTGRMVLQFCLGKIAGIIGKLDPPSCKNS